MSIFLPKYDSLFESLSEILDRRRMKWMEKVVNMPATLDGNRLPRKLLGAWIFGGKRRSGGQRKTSRNSYLDLLHKLQLDSNDSALCGSKGTLRNILELICNEPVEFNLRLDHGLNEDVREWLTGPVNVL